VLEQRREGVGIVGGEEVLGRQQIGDFADWRSDARQCSGHGFEQGAGRPLCPRGQHKNIGPVQLGDDLRNRWKLAREANLGSDAASRALYLKAGSARSVPHDHSPD